MNFKIKPLKECDKNILIKLLNIHLNAFKKFNFRNWNYSDFEDLLNSGSEIFYYESDNKIFGFVVVNFISNFNEIITIAVDNVYQGKNIGKKLLEYVVSHPKYYGELYLEVSKNNINALNFYKIFGFKIIAERKKYYLIYRGKNKGNRVDALVMKFS
jgi:ribosomal-protein-alanine N-acetyltransferase